MIDIATLSPDWLSELKRKYSKDPTIMESMVYALFLLEQLKLTGLDFIFKGGTSLVLLMEQPRRFSVDIDIIVDTLITQAEIETYLSGIAGNGPFIRMELDERRSYKNGIPKAHYKFIFISSTSTKNKNEEVISNPEREILLDILFSKNHYPVLVERPVQTEWVKNEGNPLMVKTPDINSITGDKLTAFAPNTTGVPYHAGKEKEIIKQLFDIGCLFDLLTDIGIFTTSFIQSANEEIGYRPERNIRDVGQILQDIIDTALLIAKKDMLTDETDKLNFAEISRGINQFGHYVYVDKFGILEAQVASAKAAYLAAIIKTDYKGTLKKHNPELQLNDYLITNTNYNFLNKRLKFVARGEALFYWFQTVDLLYPEGNS